MNPVRALGLTGIVLFSFACGSSKPSETPISPPKKEPIQQEQALTPVGAPADLIVVGRITGPSRVIDTGTRWAGFPFDWRTLIAKEMPGVDRVIAMDAPIDLAVTLDPAAGIEPRVHAAVSIGLTSVEQALSFFRERGELAAHGKPRIRLDQFGCVVERALGAAPARLVCGGEDEDVDALSPYMTRGLPNESFGNSDLHVHFDPGPIKRRFGAQLTMLKTAGVPFVMKELAVDDATFDGALRDVLYSGVEEIIDVIDDLDRAAVDITVDADREIVIASASMKFTGQKSWSAGTLASASGRSGRAPETFWSLPKDSRAAGFSLFSDPTRIDKPVTIVANLLAAWLGYMQLPEKPRKALVDAFQRAALGYGASFYAELPPPSLAPNEADEARQAREELRQAIGQHILGVEGAAAPFKDFFSSAVAAVSDKAFRTRLEKEKIFQDRRLPLLRQRRGKLAKGLPPDTAVFEIEVPIEPPAKQADKEPGKIVDKKPAKKAAIEPVRAVVVIVPDGQRTWILAGTDEASLYERFAATRAASAENLKTLAGLESLRGTRVVSGGFATLASFLGNLGSAFEDPHHLAAGYQRNVRLDRVTASMPHHGLVPMPYVLTADAAGPTVTASAQIHKLVVQDIAAGAAAGLAQQLDF